MTLPPEKAQDFITDVLEYHSDMIVKRCDDEDRLDHWKSLQYFWSLYPGKKCSKFGRIANRRRMAEVVVLACHLDPYEVADAHKRTTTGTRSYPEPDDASLSADDDVEPVPMVTWGPEHWSKLKQQLHFLRECLLRKDATRKIVHKQDERNAVDLKRSESAVYTMYLDRLLGKISVNAAISRFRRELESGSPVRYALLVDFRKQLDSTSNRKRRGFLEQFLKCPDVEGSSDDESEAGGIKLADRETIRNLLAGELMNLKTLQGKIMEMIMTWYTDTFKDRPPALVNLGYGDAETEIARGTANRDATQTSAAEDLNCGADDDDDEEDYPPGFNDHDFEESVPPGFDDGDDEENVPPAKYLDERKATAKTTTELEKMRRARHSLRDTAEDPFPETYEAASGAAPVLHKKRAVKVEEGNHAEDPAAKRSKGSPHKKTRGSKIEFSSSEESDDRIADHNDDRSGNEERLDKINLSELPKHHSFSNAATPQRNNRNHSLDALSGGKKRRRFTEGEKNAIREGVRRLGTGKWAEIKVAYASILSNRTNVQIKDCYRTMKKNKEI